MKFKTLFSRGCWPFTPDPAEPGIYNFGDPPEDSPILITCNSRHTLKLLQKWLTPLGIKVLAVDTGGFGLYSALGAGELARDKISHALSAGFLNISENQPDQIINTRKAILPYPVCWSLYGENVVVIDGWEIIPGPADARDLSIFFIRGRQLSEVIQFGQPRFQDSLRLTMAHAGLFCMIATIPYLLFGLDVFITGVLLAGICALIFSVILWLITKQSRTNRLLKSAVNKE